MRKMRGIGWGFLLVNCLAWGGETGPAGSEAANLKPVSTPGATAEPVIRAAGRGNPWINVTDGRPLATRLPAGSRAARQIADGSAKPLALASADFDEDGTPDIVASYGTETGGYITWHRGNVDAIYPNAPEAKARRAAGTFVDAPFLPDARLVELSERPDFVASGDFDADGHQDIVCAERSGDRLLLHSGDGTGRFSAAEEIALSGHVTAMTSGEINRRDGLTDLIVGVESDGSARVLVFEGPGGALRQAPESIAVPSSVVDLSLARLDEDPHIDLAVATATDLVVIHGRNRRLLHPEKRRAIVAAPVVERFTLPFTLTAMTSGDFDGDQESDIALLDESGFLHFAALDEMESFLAAERPPAIRIPSPSERVSDTGSSVARGISLHKARISTTRGDDLIVVRSSGRRIDLRMPRDRNPGGPDSAKGAGHRPDWVSFEAEGMPVALLSMRLNRDARSDLVVLTEGAGTPSIIETDSLTMHIVTNTDASGPGSLYQAITDANASADSDIIEFNIPGPGPHTIVDTVGVPAINDFVTIDATTEPDFAGTPVVEIDFSSSPVGDGLRISGGAVTIRGLVINGSLGHGINVSSANTCIIEGNYIGTNIAGTSAVANDLGGILLTSSISGTIGGTTAAARNVIAGDGLFPGIDLSGSDYTRVLGNYIGTNATGTAALPNGAGIVSDSDLVEIGGVGPGEGNLISGNVLDGIRLYPSGSGSMIAGNFIGTDPTGMSAIPNVGGGFLIEASGILIGGTTVQARNVISGNDNWGIHISNDGAPGSHEIVGNYIGVNASGTGALGNGYIGVDLVDTSDVLIGGSNPGARNIISDNGSGGIWVHVSSFDVDIVSNYIGTNAAGDAAFGNGPCAVEINSSSNVTVGGPGILKNIVSGSIGAGVCILNPGATGNLIDLNYIGTDVTGTVAIPNTGSGIWTYNVGRNVIGTDATPGTLISGNGENGVLLELSTDVILRRSIIGLNFDGSAALPNGLSGVRIEGGIDNFIGPTGGNTISGNTLHGVQIIGGGGNLVRRNTIGLDSTGTTAIGNGGAGVSLTDSSGNSIEDNTIAFNALDGVRPLGGISNTIYANSMYANGGLGIDLQADGVTPNDPDDPDIGTNWLQNFPVLTSVMTTGGYVYLTATLDSLPNATFDIDFYQDPICDPSGHGEGRTYVGGLGITTDAAGDASLTASYIGPLLAGEFVTATATDAGGDTSEFSACATAIGIPPAAVTGMSLHDVGAGELSWDAVPGASSYHLFVGASPTLSNLASPAPAGCELAQFPSPGLQLPPATDPPPGEMFWFMATAEGTYGEGPLQPGSGGIRELNSTGYCGSSCAHNHCLEGGPLVPACTPCAAMICEVYPSCCDPVNGAWDAFCVDQARDVCGTLTCVLGQCAHTLCNAGAPLQPGCDQPPLAKSCAAAICQVDSHCCQQAWDEACIAQLPAVCGYSCF